MVQLLWVPLGAQGRPVGVQRPPSPRDNSGILDIFCQVKFIHNLEQIG